MSLLFSQRQKANYGTAITKYNLSTWDDLTKVLYFIGKQAERSLPQCKNNPALKPVLEGFLETVGLNLDSPIQDISNAAARELATRFLDDETVKRITDNIVETIRNNSGKEFKSIRIASPFPIDESGTKNNFAPALAAAVTAKLEKELPTVLKAVGMKNIEVIAELDASKVSRDDAILNIVNNARSTLYTPPQGQEWNDMKRVTLQPVFSGNIDPDALYVPVDDFLVSQTTTAGLMNYIQSNGGTTTSPVCGIVLFKGAEVIAPQQETLDLLKLVINNDAKTKTDISKILNSAGLYIDFEKVENTTLSNIELLFVGAFFADGGNTDHQEAFKRAIEAVGGTVEQTKGKSAAGIFGTKPGTAEELKAIFEQSLEQRLNMVDEANFRFQNLIHSGRAKIYEGAAL